MTELERTLRIECNAENCTYELLGYCGARKLMLRVDDEDGKEVMLCKTFKYMKKEE